MRINTRLVPSRSSAYGRRQKQSPLELERHKCFYLSWYDERSSAGTAGAGESVVTGWRVKVTESMADRAAPAVVQPRLVLLFVHGLAILRILLGDAPGKLGFLPSMKICQTPTWSARKPSSGLPCCFQPTRRPSRVQTQSVNLSCFVIQLLASV